MSANFVISTCDFSVKTDEYDSATRLAELVVSVHLRQRERELVAVVRVDVCWQSEQKNLAVKFSRGSKLFSVDHSLPINNHHSSSRSSCVTPQLLS